MSELAAGAAFVIDGPLPVRPRYGLLDAAYLPPPSGDPHWMNGGVLRAYSSDLPDVWAPCNEGSTVDVKAEGGPTLQPQFGPYTVYLPVTCSAFSSRPDDEFRARAMVAFEAKEGWAVERELAQGIGQPLNPFLGDSNRELLASAGPVEALARLENAIAETALQGLIHADPATVTAWAALYLVQRDGSILRTTLGTPVAVGTGYVGAQVAGAPDPTETASYAFATGPVKVQRDVAEIVAATLRESLDRSTNEVTERVERNYVVSWDTALQAAILVDRAA